MRLFYPLTVANVALAAATGFAAAKSSEPSPEPTVDEILAKAIERQRLHEDAGRETLFDYELSSVTEKLDKHGDVKKSKIDGVLNKASGALFVDAETFEIARLEFDLDDKVRLWWGMLGSVSRMTGSLVRRPVDSDGWLTQSFDFYMRGRILFRSLHLRQRVRFREFERRGPSTTENRVRRSKMMDEGEMAPPFEISDHAGNKVRLSDFRGKNVVLWFYPKADTPG